MGFKKLIFLLVDLLFSVPTALYLYMLKAIRRYGVPHFPLHKRLFTKIGVFPIVDHYYEPQFVYSNAFSTSQKRSLHIQFNEQEQLNELGTMKYTDELNNFLESEHHKEFYINNPAFDSADADLLYLLIRNSKPARIIEIGSGFSTKLALKAIQKNIIEGFTTHITCIEPYEMDWLDNETGIELIRSKLELVPKSIFEELNKGDILFIDSSHITRPGNDVLVAYLEILPLLKEGVLVHIHDIFSPRDYPVYWLVQEFRFWNEQYVLEAFLSCNDTFRVRFSVNLLKHDFFDETAKTLVHMKRDKEPGSFWIERIA